MTNQSIPTIIGVLAPGGYTNDNFFTYQILEKIYTADELGKLLHASHTGPQHSLSLVKRWQSFIVLITVSLKDEFTGSVYLIDVHRSKDLLPRVHPFCSNFQWSEQNKKEFSRMIAEINNGL